MSKFDFEESHDKIALHRELFARNEKADFKKDRIMSVDYYKILRSYIDEENKLLNYRMTWLLTINGFLYASYAITFQKIIELSSGQSNLICVIKKCSGMSSGVLKLSILLCVVSLLGGLICYNAKGTIRGARRAVFYLERLVEVRFILQPVPIFGPTTKFETLLQRKISDKSKKNLLKIINIMPTKFIRRYLEAYILSENPVSYCIHVENNGLMPFITGGGYYKPSKRTNMASLYFINFLSIVWFILIMVAINNFI